MSRPRLKEKAFRDGVLACIKEHLPYVAAVDAMGASSSSAWGWKKLGEEAEEKEKRKEILDDNDKMYLDFLVAVRKARGKSLRALSKVQASHHEGDAKAVQWAMGKIAPAVYGEHKSVSVDVTDNDMEAREALRKDAALKTDEELERALRPREDDE